MTVRASYVIPANTQRLVQLTQHGEFSQLSSRPGTQTNPHVVSNSLQSLNH